MVSLSQVWWGGVGKMRKRECLLKLSRLWALSVAPPREGMEPSPYLHNITVSNVGVGGETGEAWGARVSKLSEFSGCQG